MDSNQYFGSILNNFSGSSPKGQRQDSGDGIGSLLNGYEQARTQPTRSVTDEAVGGGNVDEFVKSVAPAAQKVAQRLNVPVEAVIGQWGVETGWGKSVIPGTNNLGNIKDPTGKGVAATDNQTGSRDAYRQYGSVDEFADDFANLIGNSRYKAVSGSRDAQSYFHNLQSGGYAEAKDYVQVGTKASAMAAEALKRAGVAPAQRAQTPPDWKAFAASNDFQELSADERKQIKAEYFDKWFASELGSDAQSIRAEFLAAQDGKVTNKDANIATDVGNLAGMGVNAMAQDVRELVGRIPGVGKTIVEKLDAIDKWATGKSSDELLKGNVKAGQERLTPEMQAAGEKKWWDSDKGTFGNAWSDPRSYVSGLVQSLPEQALTMVPSMALAKGIYASKLAAGVAPEIAAAASARAATIAGGVAEGALGGAQSSRQVRDKIMEMTPDQLQNSDALKALVSQGVPFEQAREQLANDSATQAFILAGITTGMFGGMGDRMMAKAITEGIGKNIAGRVAKGVVGEGLLEEFPQSYTQAVSENIAMRRADPSISLTHDALNQGLGGLAVGALQGGGMAAGFGHNKQQPAPQAQGSAPSMAPDAAPAAASTTPDGRIEPTLDGNLSVTPAEPAGAPAVHPTVQSADDIVRELATDAGIPHETVLPAAPQQTTGPESVSDQDVQEFASNRYQQLREKRDGSIQSVVGEAGFVDQDVPGVGLTPAEQTELDTLQRAGNDPKVLRQLYGFDQSIPSDQSQLANQAQVPAPATGPVEQPVGTPVVAASTEPGLVAAQENSNVQTQGQDQATGPALDQGASIATGQPGGPAPVQEPTAQAPATQGDVGNAVGNPGQQDSTVQANGALTEQQPAPQGQFASADEAKKYISQQRRASSTTLPRALPLPYLDGTFGIATEKSEGWADAVAYDKANAPKTEKQAKERRQKSEQPEVTEQRAQETTKSEQEQTTRYEYPTPNKGQPAYIEPAQRAVVDFMNGEIDKAALLQRFSDLDLTEAQIRSVTNRIDITKDEIDSVAALRAAKPKTEKEAKAQRSKTEQEVENLMSSLPNGGFGRADQTADERKLVRKMVAGLIDKGLSAGKTNEEILASIDNSTRQVLGTFTITELDKLITGKRNGTQVPQAQQAAQEGSQAPVAADSVTDKRAQIEQGFSQNREALKALKVGDDVEFAQPGTYTQPDGSKREGLVVRGKIEKITDKDQGTVKVGNYTVAARKLRKVEAKAANPTTEKEAKVQRQKKAAPKVEKSATPEEKSSITDFGEKIGGAKKDVWTGFKDKLNEVGDDQIASKKLSEVWPSPDYQALIDGGMDKEAVAIIRTMRDEIPAKPRAPYKVKRWAEQVKSLRQFANSIMDGTITPQRVREEVSKHSGRFKAMFGRADLYMEVGHGKSLEGIRLAHHHYTRYKGRENVSLWVVERDSAATAFSNWPQELATGDTKEEAIAAFKAKYDTLDAQAAVKKASFDIFSQRGKEGYFIGKQIGRNLATIEGPFATVKEAREYRSNHLADLEAKLEKYKEIPRERRDTNEPRVGEDMRNGQDVTPELFANTFGFRGVEFGNWVEQKRRQKDLNDAFDALMDMAAVLGIPAKAISLNGELGLAFGARGSGGKNPAAAHYEPGKVVINLTKINGAGSLGHEWFHALDNYFANQRKAGGYMTTASDVGLSAREANYYYESGKGVRKEMIDAFGAVMKSINQTAMKKRSANLDSKRTKEYWGTGEELGARAFEAYLISKLQDQEASNDYLANIVDEKTWNAAAALGIENQNSYPYPTETELPSIRAGFDQFFQTIQHERTDKGVRLFSISDRSVPLSAGQWMTESAVLAEVAKRIDKFAHQPRVIVRDRAQGVLPSATEADRVSGAVFENSIYLFRSQLATVADVQKTLFHELLHYGLRKLYSRDQFVEEMHKLYNRDAWIKARADAWVKSDEGKAANEFGGLDYALARGVDEALARLAEPNAGIYTQTDLASRVVIRVTKWLADLAEGLGFNGLAAKIRGMKNQEARDLIRAVFQRLDSDQNPNFDGSWDITDTAYSKLGDLTFNDFSQSPSISYAGVPESVRVNARQKLEKLGKKLDEGKITESEFVLAAREITGMLNSQKDAQEDRNSAKVRRRGYDWVVAQLNRYVADEGIDREVASFANWLLDQNPNLANDLGISITTKGNVAGDYNAGSRVFRLVTGNVNTGTAVHEILHHSERMMPKDVQDGVLHEWQRAWFSAFKAGDKMMQQALLDMAQASLGNKAAFDRVQAAFNDGTLVYDQHYQLYSPSEFWAVNATRILSGRYGAKGSWVKRAVQWFKEFVQRVKGVFGLPSDAPILKALKSVMTTDGQFQMDAKMLVDRAGEKTSSEGERTFNDISRKAQNNAIQFFGNRNGETLKTFGLYDKTLSTQYNKALKDKHFGKVFGYVNAMQNEVSLTSIRPAELAPGVLPRVDDVKSAAIQLVKGKKSDNHLNIASKAIFDGTLDSDSVMQGKVWSQSEFMARPGATEAAWGLYQQARAAIDASLNEVAAAEAYAMAQGFVPKAMRRQIIDNPANAEKMIVYQIQKQIKMLDVAIEKAKSLGADEQQADLEAARESYLNTQTNIKKIFATAKSLKQAGYAPLMRFGKFTVTVQPIDPATGNVLRDENGESITEFYGQYETEGEAKSVRNQMEAKYADRDDIRVKAGTKSQTSHELYSGISPETLALFAEAIGADNAMRKYIELAMTERSALKRRLHRKGTEGYSEDLPRVLSQFITSNGRHAAQRYYLRDLNNAIKYIPKEKGDVLDEAIRLKTFVLNPNDPAAPVSSVMFAWFLGGSVASAVVNLTQPLMMTAPYLSQFGMAATGKAMATAMPYALGKKQITDMALRDALKRASQEGIVDAQEIFHLYSVGAQGVASGLVNQLAKLPGVGGKIKAGSEDARARINAFMTLWGSMFAVAEGFNRKLTFVAAWEVAKVNGEKNPFAFAVRAVNETQGIYNKVNRPNWSQGKVGRVLMTFKQYSIMYVELLTRMWKHGGPEGKRAALIMLAVLMLSAGEEGLPFAQDLDDLIDTVGQMFGLDTNMKRNKRRLAHELLGKSLGDMFLYGVSPYLPLDFAGRIGLGNLIPGTGVLKPSNTENRGREMVEVLGPTAGMASQIGDAYDAVTEGNMGKAVQNLAPKAIKDLLAAGEMTKKGYSTDSKGRKVVDVTLSDAAIKGIGFQPTMVAQETRKTMPVQQDIALQKKTETSIVNQWVRGLADNDMEMAKEAQQRLNDWNRRNPGTPIQITPDQIRNLARQMATEKDARLLKSAPREMRGRVGLDLAK
jgi:hypothetical protein